MHRSRSISIRALAAVGMLSSIASADPGAVSPSRQQASRAARVALLELRVPEELAAEGIVLGARGLAIGFVADGSRLAVALVDAETGRTLGTTVVERLPDDAEAAVAIVTQVAAGLVATAVSAPPPPPAAGALPAPESIAAPADAPDANPTATDARATATVAPADRRPPLYLAVGGAIGVAGHDAYGARVDADAFAIGPLSFGVSATLLRGPHEGLDAEWLGTIAGTISLTGSVDSWGASWRVRLTAGAGAGFYRAWRWGRLDNPTLPAFEAALLVGPRLGSWAIAAGPVATMTASAWAGLYDGDGEKLDDANATLLLYAGVAHAF